MWFYAALIVFFIFVIVLYDRSSEKELKIEPKPSKPSYQKTIVKPAECKKELFLPAKEMEIKDQQPFYVILDVETDGLPIRRRSALSDLHNWPYVVSMAWLIVNRDFKIIDEYYFVIKPRRGIPPKARSIHGITTDYALKHGTEISEVLNIFNKAIVGSAYLVCHNIEFDRSIVYAEHLRIGLYPSFRSLKQICTMKASIPFVNVSNGYGLKYPKLTELLYACFDPMSNKYMFQECDHDALYDAKVTLMCFNYLYLNHKVLFHPVI